MKRNTAPGVGWGSTKRHVAPSTALLAFTPTAAIGLNADLEMPRWRFKSNAPPSTFAYPPVTGSEKK